MSLAQITDKTRFILKWLGIIIGFFIFVFLIFKIKDILFPPPPPPPTVSFGKLPALDFPQSESAKNLTYTIDTISGTLPSFQKVEKVYKIDDKKPDLLSLDKANNIAKTLDFEEKPTGVSENVYQWKQKNGTTLTINILNFNFNYTTNYLSAPSNFDKDKDLAISASVDFLQRMGLLYDDLDQTKTKSSYFAVKNFQLVPTTSLSSAQLVRVEFFQKNFNGLPIYYPSTSPMNFLVKTERGTPQIAEANFFYQKPSEKFATYPIKESREAFNSLKKGEAFILEFPATQKVSIKKVSLGYYISDKKQVFLMPIAVFEADNFKAYVSATADEWVNK